MKTTVITLVKFTFKGLMMILRKTSKTKNCTIVRIHNMYKIMSWEEYSSSMRIYFSMQNKRV